MRVLRQVNIGDKCCASRQTGFSLLELTVSLLIAASIFAGLMNVLGETLQTERSVRAKLEVSQQASLALHHMITAVGRTQYLMLPLPENPNTATVESVRDVLAVTLDYTLDRDGDFWADANNDKDFQDLNQNGIRDSGEWERIDEDTGADMTNDGEPGIIGIDDDGDGSVDELHFSDDDEDSFAQEEVEGADEDGDRAFSEDLADDRNGDNEAGIAGVDDDGDGTVDEGASMDDDEDGSYSEDWLDPVVYYLANGDLIERVPSINPSDGSDFIESTILTNVSHFQVTRLPSIGLRTTLVLIELSVLDTNNTEHSFQVTVGEGGLL